MATVRSSSLLVAHGHGRPEEDLAGEVVVARRRRIDDLGDVEPLDQVADAPVDLAQALLAVDVVAVLRAIAVAGRPRHRRDEFRPLLLHEVLELAGQAARSRRASCSCARPPAAARRASTSSSSSASDSRVNALLTVSPLDLSRRDRTGPAFRCGGKRIIVAPSCPHRSRLRPRDSRPQRWPSSPRSAWRRWSRWPWRSRSAAWQSTARRSFAR